MTDDPRIEAAAKVISPALHAWHDGFDEGTCPDCQAVARDALAAADAVDPLRVAVRDYLAAMDEMDEAERGATAREADRVERRLGAAFRSLAEVAQRDGEPAIRWPDD